MTVKELKEYLNGFPEEKQVIIVAAQIQERKRYDADLIGITGSPVPVIIVDLRAAHDFDEKERACADECESGKCGKHGGK